MWNEPTQEQLKKIPKLYSQQNTHLRDILIYMHFFIGNLDWFIAEYDGKDSFFGYVNLNDDFNSEWGYFSLKEFRDIKINKILEIDRDLHWEIKPASEIPKIIKK